MNYELFCQSIRGASHIRKDTPREDYGLKIDQDGFKIFVTADGHGDPNCMRSSVGSELLCKIVGKVFLSFANHVSEKKRESELLDKNENEKLIKQVIFKIVNEWKRAVNNDLSEHPLTKEELAAAPAFAKEYSKGIRTERIYGTTLIAGLQAENYLLLLQQGDGRCVVFDCDGNASQPIPWDDRCVGTATTSMCDTDAEKSCRYCVIDLNTNPVIACIAGSDGVEDSFPTSMEKTYAYYRELLSDVCDLGIEKLEEKLNTDLSDLSKNGSQDDVTVSGIIDIERVRPLLTKFKEENRIVDIEDEIIIYEGRVKSIEEGGRFQYLKNKYDEISAKYEAVEKEFKEIDTECNELGEKVAAHENGVPESIEDTDGLVPFIKKLLLPKEWVGILKRKYEELCKTRDDEKEKLEAVGQDKAKAEGDYMQYKERYDNCIKQLEDARLQLDSLKKTEN